MKQLDEFLPANERGLAPDEWMKKFGEKRLADMVPKGRNARLARSGVER